MKSSIRKKEWKEKEEWKAWLVGETAISFWFMGGKSSVEGKTASTDMDLGYGLELENHCRSLRNYNQICDSVVLVQW